MTRFAMHRTVALDDRKRKPDTPWRSDVGGAGDPDDGVAADPDAILVPGQVHASAPAHRGALLGEVGVRCAAGADQPLLPSRNSLVNTSTWLKRRTVASLPCADPPAPRPIHGRWPALPHHLVSALQ